MIVFQYIYTLYVALSFIISLPFAVLFYLCIAWLPDRKQTHLRYRYHYYWFTIWGYCCGIRFKFEDMDRISKDQASVIISNHCNMLDIPATSLAVSSFYVKPLVKKEITKIPLLGTLFKMAAIPVERDNPESRKQSVATMIKNVKEKGMSIFIYPEGTRNKTGLPLKSFYDGAFKIAIETQVPIHVTLLLNSRAMQPVGTFLVKPGEITIKYIKTIETNNLTLDDVPQLKQDVFNLMEQEILKYDTFFNTSK